MIRSWLVSDDPERAWAGIKPSEVFRMARYDQWARDAGDAVTEFRDPYRIPQRWIVGDAAHCIAEISAFVRAASTSTRAAT